MGFFKITKSAKQLTRSAIEYLDKDKDMLTKKQIEYNITYSKFKKNPTDELKRKVVILRKQISEHKDVWNKKSHSDVRLSGYLRTSVYQQGYGKLKKKDQIDLIIKNWNSKLDSISDKKDKHVGLRRYVLAPTIKEMAAVSGFNFKNYAEDSIKFAKTHGKEALEGNKEIINNFFDGLVRDVMKRFKDRYVMKGDDIGYAFSIHHDTKIPHAHVYLMPYSKKEAYLSMNAAKFLRGKGEKEALRNENQLVENKLDFLKDTTDKRLKHHIGHYQSFNSTFQTDIKMNPTLEKNLKTLRDDNKPEMGLSLGL